jgi:hypothetical protein
MAIVLSHCWDKNRTSFSEIAPEDKHRGRTVGQPHNLLLHVIAMHAGDDGIPIRRRSGDHLARDPSTHDNWPRYRGRMLFMHTPARGDFSSCEATIGSSSPRNTRTSDGPEIPNLTLFRLVSSTVTVTLLPI